MAKVVKREGRWVADYYDAQGRRHREYRKTKREATDLLAQRLEAIAKGSFRGDGRKIGFQQFAREWLDARADSWSPSTRDLNRMVVERYLLSPDIGLGRLKVAAIDLRVVERFRANLREHNPDLSGRTVNIAMRTLGAILKHAQQHGLRSDNPVQFVAKLPERRREVDPLRPAEVEKLLATAQEINPTLHALVAVALYTGMRFGELTALRWQDLEGEVLQVRGTNSHPEHRQRFRDTGQFADPKTERSRRRVVLSSTALRILREHRLRTGNPPDEGLIFTNRRGQPIDSPNFRNRWWLRLIREADIREDFTFHSLRHCYASTMLAAGAPVEFVQRQLGHKSYQTTLSTYRHLIPERDDQHAALIETALAVGNGQ